jgi:hypothetical protein
MGLLVLKMGWHYKAIMGLGVRILWVLPEVASEPPFSQFVIKVLIMLHHLLLLVSIEGYHKWMLIEGLVISPWGKVVGLRVTSSPLRATPLLSNRFFSLT